MSGGLGPTADDVTREAAAKAFGRGLSSDPAVLAAIEAHFRSHGSHAAAQPQAGGPHRGRQAARQPARHRARAGLDGGRCTFFLSPAYRASSKGSPQSAIVPWLRRRWDGGGIERRVLKVACVPESGVEERIAPAYAEFGREWITVLAKPAEIRSSGRRRAPGARRERLARMQSRLRDLIGDAVFAERRRTRSRAWSAVCWPRAGRPSPPASRAPGAGRRAPHPGAGVERLLPRRRGRLLERGEAAVLGVPADLIAREGAVSEAAARALARGAIERFGAELGDRHHRHRRARAAAAREAGGLVHIAVAGPAARSSTARPVFPGDRERVRWQSSQRALDLLRRQARRARSPDRSRGDGRAPTPRARMRLFVAFELPPGGPVAGIAERNGPAALRAAASKLVPSRAASSHAGVPR